MQKRNKNILLIVLFIASLSACENYYVPSLDSQDPHLIFYGLITNSTGSQFVEISQSSGYNDVSSTDGVSGFNVVIEEKNGETIVLSEVDTVPGYYVSDSNAVGNVNSYYRIIATSPEGKIYTSSYEQMLPAAEINSISGAYYEETSLVEEYEGGGYYEETEDGITIQVSSNTNGYTPFYRYEYRLAILSTDYYPFGMGKIMLYFAVPYDSFSKKFLSTANGNLFSNNNIIEQSIANIRKFILQKQVVLDSTIIIDGVSIYIGGGSDFSSQGMLVQLCQYSLSEEAYNFWIAIENQMESTGQFFDPIEAQVSGNIVCESDTTEDVYGYFGASAIETHPQYLYLGSDNKVIVKEANYFPEIQDTLVSDEPFDFWIDY